MPEEKIIIIGYYKDPEDAIEEYSDGNEAANVFVAMEIGLKDRIGVYCPIGQHGEIQRSYLEDCSSISKEEYKTISRLFYTPEDYL